MSVMADTSVQILVRTSESIVRCTVSVAVFRQTLRNCTLASPLGFVAASLLFLSAPGLLSKTWLTGETALAVDLVGSSRQTWSLGNAMADSETSVTFPPYFQPCTLSIFHFRPVPLSRDESLLFLMPCFPPSLSLSTPFPASRGMTSSLLAALRAKRETAYPFSCSSSSLALSLRHHLPDKTSPPLAG